MSSSTESLSQLLQQQISKPLYFRVIPDQEGKLRVEQIKFLTTDELAILTGAEPRTIRGWVERKLLRSYKPEGTGHHLFELNETLRFLMTVPANSENK